MRFASPRDALDRGIATVYQDLAMVPLMSIARNFFMGREPVKGRGIFQRFDHARANQVARDEMARIGIRIRDPGQAVGTLSGGERQCVAIARAVHFGARVLILDEPTSALGVKQASVVLRYVAQARGAAASASIFITHNVHHAYPVGDKFMLLNRGRSARLFRQERDQPRRSDEHDGRRPGSQRAGAGPRGIRADSRFLDAPARAARLADGELVFLKSSQIGIAFPCCSAGRTSYRATTGGGAYPPCAFLAQAGTQSA